MDYRRYIVASALSFFRVARFRLHKLRTISTILSYLSCGSFNKIFLKYWPLFSSPPVVAIRLVVIFFGITNYILVSLPSSFFKVSSEEHLRPPISSTESSTPSQSDHNKIYLLTLFYGPLFFISLSSANPGFFLDPTEFLRVPNGHR